MSEEPTGQTPQPKPKRRGRRLLVGAVGVLLVLFVLVALAPTLLSTAPGKNFLLGFVNDALNGRVEADSISLSWLGGQKATGVTIKAGDGSTVVSKLDLDAPKVTLIDAATGLRDTGPINAHAQAVALREDAQGNLILPTAAKPAKPEPSSGGGTDISTQVTLTVGRITYERPGEQPYVIDNFKAGGTLDRGHKASLTVTGNIVRGSETGLIDINASVDNLADTAGKLQPDKANLDVNVKLLGIPTAPLDALAGADGQIGKLVGEKLDFVAQAKGTLKSFEGEAVLPTMNVPAGEGRALRFSDGVLEIKPGDAAGQMRLALRGRAQTGDLTKDIAATVVATNLLEADKPKAINVTTRDLPVALVDALAGQDGKLTQTLGDLLGLTLDLSQRDDGTMVFDGRVDAPNLAGPIKGSFADFSKDAKDARAQLIELATPQPLRMTLSPRAYDLWLADKQTGAAPNRGLVDPAQVTVGINAWKLVLLKPRPGVEPGALGVLLDADASRIDATVTMPAARVIDRTTKQDRLGPRPAAHVRGNDLSALELFSSLEFPDPGPDANAKKDPGKLTSTTKIRGLFNKQGAAVFADAAITSKTSVTNMPATLVDAVAGQQGKLAALTGPSISGGLDLTQKPGQPGSATLALDATHLKLTAPVNLAITDDDIKLIDDFVLTLLVTEQTSSSLLGDIHPLFADSVASVPGKPMKLTINKGVALDRGKTFDLADVRMDGSIDLGTLMMKRRGWIALGIEGAANALIGIFKLGRDIRVAEAADYPATFSPMTFSVAGGKVKTSELWMTAPDMAVGFQGNVDLTSNTIDQMSVALLGASLYTFPGSRELFQGLVKPTQVIEMPLGGSLSAPKPKPVDFAVNTPLAIAEGALGEDAGRIIGVIRDLGREAQPWQKRRPRFEWHPSADALAFAGKFKAAEQPATQPAGDAEQPAEATPEQPQQQQEEPQEEKSIEERLEEEAIRAGTGLLRDLLNSRRSQ